MTRRLAAFAALLAIGAVACRAIPAPTDGVLSLSSVHLPSPAVVVNDTMRDSAGLIAPLGVTAFGVGGESDTLMNVKPTFLVFDPGAHVTPEGYLVGDSVRDTPVRVIASVGTLQTSTTNVDVIPRPDSLAANGPTTASPDTFSVTDPNSVYTKTVSAKVLSAGQPVRSVIVRWTIVGQPATADTAPTGTLVSAAKRPVSADTSDATGSVSVGMLLDVAALNALSAPDSFVVEASMSYAGVPLHGSPVRFVFPVVPAPKTQSSRSGNP
ncbi:MAG: hypothetical protein KGL93_08820 [Gemmatimonadota bacterium]|nr:hypothetical protein [Gemmatimonadota bacterium]HEU4990017.1 hypothetical protein [Gemmatimonadaceae bacterium]